MSQFPSAPAGPGSTPPTEGTNPSPRLRRRSSNAIRVAAVIGAFAVAITGVSFVVARNQDKVTASASLPPTDTNLNSRLGSFLSVPVQFEHKIFDVTNTDPHTYVQGYMDLTTSCSYDAVLTGALYSVELRSNGTSLWQRSTKRETGAIGGWELSLPLNSNVNSPLLGLSGNPSSLYCQLKDISRVLRSGTELNSFTVDTSALAQLTALRRSEEIAAMYVLAGEDPATAQSLSPAEVNVEPIVALLEKVVVEQQDQSTLRITMVGAGNRRLDEITLRHTETRQVSAPAPVEARTTRQQAGRMILGLTD
jgi:hypothetical protein